MEHIKVSSVSEAWRAAARIFPTDYEKNEENSKRAGYPIYETTSTDERFSGFHISDLNTRLVSNDENNKHSGVIERSKRRAAVSGFHFLRCVWTRWRVCRKISQAGNESGCHWTDSDGVIYEQRRSKGLYHGRDCRGTGICRE